MGRFVIFPHTLAWNHKILDARFNKVFTWAWFVICQRGFGASMLFSVYILGVGVKPRQHHHHKSNAKLIKSFYYIKIVCWRKIASVVIVQAVLLMSTWWFDAWWLNAAWFGVIVRHFASSAGASVAISCVWTERSYFQGRGHSQGRVNSNRLVLWQNNCGNSQDAFWERTLELDWLGLGAAHKVLCKIPKLS